jgi:hypothetical protein
VRQLSEFGQVAADALQVLAGRDVVVGQAADLVRLTARGLRRQRFVEQMQQMGALPEAEPERDGQYCRADNQPVPKLVEVIDDAQAVFVADRPKALRHLTTRPPTLGAVLRIRRR